MFYGASQELAQHWYTQGLRLSDRLVQLEQKYGFFEMNTHYFFAPTPEVGDRVFAGIRRKGADGKIEYPKEIGGHKGRFVFVFYFCVCFDRFVSFLFCFCVA